MTSQSQFSGTRCLPERSHDSTLLLRGNNELANKKAKQTEKAVVSGVVKGDHCRFAQRGLHFDDSLIRAAPCFMRSTICASNQSLASKNYHDTQKTGYTLIRVLTEMGADVIGTCQSVSNRLWDRISPALQRLALEFLVCNCWSVNGGSSSCRNVRSRVSSVGA